MTSPGVMRLSSIRRPLTSTPLTLPASTMCQPVVPPLDPRVVTRDAFMVQRDVALGRSADGDRIGPELDRLDHSQVVANDEAVTGLVGVRLHAVCLGGLGDRCRAATLRRPTVRDNREKGVGSRLPEWPGGCFAQTTPDPVSPHNLAATG